MLHGSFPLSQTLFNAQNAAISSFMGNIFRLT